MISCEWSCCRELLAPPPGNSYECDSKGVATGAICIDVIRQELEKRELAERVGCLEFDESERGAGWIAAVWCDGSTRNGSINVTTCQ